MINCPTTIILRMTVVADVKIILAHSKQVVLIWHQIRWLERFLSIARTAKLPEISENHPLVTEIGACKLNKSLQE